MKPRFSMNFTLTSVFPLFPPKKNIKKTQPKTAPDNKQIRSMSLIPTYVRKLLLS